MHNVESAVPRIRYGAANHLRLHELSRECGMEDIQQLRVTS